FDASEAVCLRSPLSTLPCRDHRPDFSATFTTIAFDDSSLQWLGISDLIAEPEGPSFISCTVTQPPCGPALLVTQDPIRTLAWVMSCSVRNHNSRAGSRPNFARSPAKLLIFLHTAPFCSHNTSLIFVLTSAWVLEFSESTEAKSTLKTPHVP